MFTPPGVITNGYPTTTHALGNVTPPNHVHLPGNLNSPSSHVGLPGEFSAPPSHVHLSGVHSAPPNHVRLPGGPSSPLPNVGLARFKPSPEVAMLGPLGSTAVIPVNSTQSSVGSQKPIQTSSPPSASKQLVPVVSNKSRSRKGTRLSCFWS